MIEGGEISLYLFISKMGINWLLCKKMRDVTAIFYVLWCFILCGTSYVLIKLPWGDKLHMDQGLGHTEIDRTGPKESNGAQFLFYHYSWFCSKIPLKTTSPIFLSPLKTSCLLLYGTHIWRPPSKPIPNKIAQEVLYPLTWSHFPWIDQCALKAKFLSKHMEMFLSLKHFEANEFISLNP